MAPTENADRPAPPAQAPTSLASAVALSEGGAMPWVGLGVWQAQRGDEAYRAVLHALEVGYRHVDTAKIYGNEKDVGRAIRDSGVAREELFITTKLWNTDHGFDKARRACEASLSALGLDYVDLYLIHWPERERLESWRALTELRNEGKCRAIGVSNYTIRHLDELLAQSGTAPAVNQVEFHPFLYQKELLEYCRGKSIVLEAYSPLARAERLEHPTIAKLAHRKQRTAAQILLRWGLEHGVVVIPKSVRRSRIEENAHLFDFSLTEDEVKILDGLNENLRTCWDPSAVS